MRFAFTATLLTLASAASAAVIERQTGGILKCICFPDLYNDKGTLISTTTTTYTCAYAKGSCEWNQVVGTLVNNKQGNCAQILRPCT